MAKFYTLKNKMIINLAQIVTAIPQGNGLDLFLANGKYEPIIDPDDVKKIQHYITENKW